MNKRAAFYVRVSTTAGQTVENQLRDLHAVAERSGWDVIHIFADEGVSGKHGRDKRPAFDAMMKAITRREIDIVASWSVCRIGRSLQHLVGFLAEINASHVDLYLHQQSIDTSTPAGRALFGMLGVFSELERSLIAERVKSGLNRAREAGKHCGRPKLEPAKVQTVEKLLTQGLSIDVIAKKARVGVGSVCRIKARMKQAA
ncbi:MAG: recombinase family protein [Hoeflea sp.]|nr:recombinase family protein [Hoeflea sp.]